MNNKLYIFLKNFLSVKNKILYRAAKFIALQSHIRMWRYTRKFKPK